MNREEIVVYWASLNYDFETLSIDHAYNDILERINSMDGREPARSTDIKNCPSVTEYLKNTFRVKSPTNFNIGWTGNSFFTQHPDQKFFYEHLTPRDFSAGFASCTFTRHLFFTEEPSLVMQAKKANFSMNEFNFKTCFIEGQVDIGKWFRPTDLAFFINEPGQVVNIERGDSLFYVKFLTDKKIKLKRFRVNREIEEILEAVLSSRSRIPSYFKNNVMVKKLERYYNIFTQSGYKHRIIKIIKDNLLEEEIK